MFLSVNPSEVFEPHVCVSVSAAAVSCQDELQGSEVKASPRERREEDVSDRGETTQREIHPK